MSCGGTATIKPQIRRLQVPTDSEEVFQLCLEKNSGFVPRFADKTEANYTMEN